MLFIENNMIICVCLLHNFVLQIYATSRMNFAYCFPFTLLWNHFYIVPNYGTIAARMLIFFEVIGLLTMGTTE